MKMEGTVEQDFRPPFFYQRYMRLGPWCIPLHFSILILNSWSYLNLSSTNRCIKKQGVRSCCCIMQRRVKSLHWVLQWEVDSPLQNATESRVSDFCKILPAVWFSQAENLGRLPRPLIEKSNKSQIWGLRYVIPMQTIYETLLAFNFFEYPLYDAAGSQTSRSKNSSNLRLKTQIFQSMNNRTRWVRFMK
jgi:hypothetical protein